MVLHCFSVTYNFRRLKLLCDENAKALELLRRNYVARYLTDVSTSPLTNASTCCTQHRDHLVNGSELLVEKQPRFTNNQLIWCTQHTITPSKIDQILVREDQ